MNASAPITILATSSTCHDTGILGLRSVSTVLLRSNKRISVPYFLANSNTIFRALVLYESARMLPATPRILIVDCISLSSHPR